MNKPEYKVRPVTRYVVTSHTEVATSVVGEFTDRLTADSVCEALTGYEFVPGILAAASENWLANIPQLLKNITEQLESGALEASRGVLILRADDQRLPSVFGLGSTVDPWQEMTLAGEAVDRMCEAAPKSNGRRLQSA